MEENGKGARKIGEGNTAKIKAKELPQKTLYIRNLDQSLSVQQVSRSIYLSSTILSIYISILSIYATLSISYLIYPIYLAETGSLSGFYTLWSYPGYCNNQRNEP